MVSCALDTLEKVKFNIKPFWAPPPSCVLLLRLNLFFFFFSQNNSKALFIPTWCSWGQGTRDKWSRETFPVQARHHGACL